MIVSHRFPTALTLGQKGSQHPLRVKFETASEKGTWIGHPVVQRRATRSSEKQTAGFLLPCRLHPDRLEKSSRDGREPFAHARVTVREQP